MVDNLSKSDVFKNRLCIVGTSHISTQSMEDIKKSFLKLQPDVISVELDEGRLHSLLHPEQQKISLGLIKKVGVRGFIFLLIGRYAQKKMGKLVGVTPGSDMLFAVTLARNNNLRLRLIDKPLDKVIKRLMKQLTAKEIGRFFVDIFKGLFFRKSQSKIKISLDKVPPQDLIIKLMKQLKQRYPTIYRVLVDERNHFMARQLALQLKKTNDKILAVVGAGHEVELEILVKDYYNKIEII